ncbi:MAG: CarD family transcriptional regulator [Acidobacteriota bacterium]
MTFKVGDKVVYPNHGIGVIQDIQDREFYGQQERFYSLRILANDTMVMVPLSNADGVGLRKIIKGSEVDRVIDILKGRDLEVHKNWKGRFKENSNKMRTGSIFEVAEVYKNLAILSRNKVLSYREKRMLDKARYLLVSEISQAGRMAESAAETKIDSALASCRPSRMRIHAHA